MSLAQLHYTSAAGFTAVSPDVPRDLLDEAEEVLAAFPASAFSLTQLSDGSRLLSRTTTDPESGAAHTHAVHLPAGVRLPGGALPITAWDSPRWAPLAPAPGSTPEPLDLLTPAAGFFDRDGLADFAASCGARLAGVLADVRTLCEDPGARPVVLVEEDPADIARWVAVLGAALPREHAHGLTFTTYAERPEHALQQIIGTSPDVVFPAAEFRVHRPGRVGTDAGSAGVEDAWAAVAAQVWLAARPELFKRAAAQPSLHDGEFEEGPLAATALSAGVPLDSRGRTAATLWAEEHADGLNASDWPALLGALCAPVPGSRPDGELDALARLAERIDGKVPTEILAPLAALFAAEDDNPAAVPELARQLAHELLAEPDRARSAAVREALDRHSALHAQLLVHLDDLAPDNPFSVVRLLHTADLVRGVPDGLPHLRMCAAYPLPGASRQGQAQEHGPDAEDRDSTLHTVLRAAGVSPMIEPLVLRTGFRLVWPENLLPTPQEARWILGETGSDAHRTAGTYPELIRAALEGPADDPDVTPLAADLIRCFPHEIDARQLGALRMLEFAESLAEGRAGAGPVATALTLRSAAHPVEANVLQRAYGLVARELLSEQRPLGELSALARSGDADLLGAYGSVARTAPLLDRLRTAPSYAADCFMAWTAHTGASGLWDDTRAALLEEVLRPALQHMTSREIASLLDHLDRAGGTHASDFRAWHKPGGPLGRLARRFGRR
ncbi:GTPase-associated protein 1-related protein [Streptomyces sp. NBC_00237]|uniref:GTPase-associated protein 1-related protein n=1 Tax=Streptomyces sp. NBC_00237 TaxID=2975687 RepID=UPI00224DB685|nr:GTPase-associated protein 1-related protein [Streptomyces sp. NBC_00237]MCX5203472.1 GTPase-associated protein 1-related protein [Streptomyces sp. NBC_00237]